MKAGLAAAAETIRAEATTDEDLDLAALCEYVAEVHRPGDDMLCVSCGERWYAADEFPNLGGIRCQTYIDAVLLKNSWINLAVQAKRAKLDAFQRRAV